MLEFDYLKRITIKEVYDEVLEIKSNIEQNKEDKEEIKDEETN